ncbi:hypothetical protein C8R42DRAFT_198083 [Lentinula raphanica]|nr:hypothetical protein C8R42DRAFT_198083 [Lentinula raphanica]
MLIVIPIILSRVVRESSLSASWRPSTLSWCQYKYWTKRSTEKHESPGGQHHEPVHQGNNGLHSLN